MQHMISHSNTFHFGENWQEYLAKHYTEESLTRSADSLRAFLGRDLAGRSFLDAGCGSGIHSLAALQLGAERVMSFDADSASVEAARSLKNAVASGSKWDIAHASLLNKSYLSTLGQFDVVYCWGVAHHTGNMWEALANLYPLVAPGGSLFVAIYNTVPGRFGSTWWEKVKKLYMRMPRLGQKIMEWGYISYHVLRLVIRFKNPFAVMRSYKQKRGMSWITDLVDWLGGYPYEHATPERIFLFYKDRFKMELINLKTTVHIGCNQYLFLKR